MFSTIREDWRRHKVSGTRVVLPLLVYRFGRWAQGLKWVLLRKVFGLIYVLVQPISALVGGIYLYRDTNVGESPHFIHGGNIQISPLAKIGDRVGIMHGVTIGADMKTGMAPTIGDDVFLGANCSILGNVTVGAGARVAANSLVINNVPEKSFAIGVPAKSLPDGLLK